MRQLSFYILSVFIFFGCATTTPKINEYTIIPLYSPQDRLTAPSNLSLKLTPTKSIDSLASKKFYYLRDTAQIGSYLYSRWADTPASMIDRSLISSLENRHLFTTLLPVTSSGYADVTLESDLHAFYHRFQKNGSSEGYIDITYRYVESKSKKVIASKRFVIIAPSLSADAAGGVNALSDGTKELTDQCILWLSTQIKEKK
jgi:cholesterol transport system auxiliary component